MEEGAKSVRSPMAKIAVIAVVMLGMAAAMHAPLVGAAPLVSPAPFPAWALPLLFLAAEMCVVHIHVRRQAHTLSLTEAPIVLGLVFFSPLVVVGARLLGSALSLFAGRRQPLIKLVFNLSLFALETGLITVVVRVLAIDPLTPAGWCAILLATLLALGVSSAAISLAIAIVEGDRPRGWLRSVTVMGTIFIVLATMSGLLASMVLRDSPSAWVLLLGGAIALAMGLRGHADLRERHTRLEGAYSFTTDAVASLELGEDRSALLGRACELLRASWAELAVGGEGGDVLVLTNHGENVTVATGSAAADVLAHRLRLLDGQPGVILTGDEPEAPGDAVLVELPDTGLTRGTFLVAERLGSVDRFDEGDLRLLETIGAQAAVVLRNRALLDRLRQESADREYRALHDALTQLPNRMLFDVELQKALDDRGESIVAVLLIDLDRFKDVNDTLGHQQGDRLLQDVAVRMVNALPATGFVARLAGDEFAIILRAVDSLDAVVEAAQSMLATLAEPFVLAELLVDVGASVGIAAAPFHGDDTTTLLQRADVAMYAAKARGSGVAVYDPADDRNSRERLGLVAELRTAIEREELRVEFQPIIDLASGNPVGAEALCRWHHPTKGLVPPDQFIPLAEASGLIRPLTEFVLTVALRHLKSWRDAGHNIGVSVNLSMRNLLDDALIETVTRLLDETGVPPSSVTLEVTESSFMAEPIRTIGILNRLSSMGLRLSIDDFGTGYSSLSQLHELPVDELKVDRSFVEDLASSKQDLAIVQAIADLARALDLEVTAEGIEDRRTLELLAGLGCHNGQGFSVSRPMRPALFDRWLHKRRAEAVGLEALLVSESVVELPALND
jgi:diguanylate cyclase (GGDEF)-like protein